MEINLEQPDHEYFGNKGKDKLRFFFVHPGANIPAVAIFINRAAALTWKTRHTPKGHITEKEVGIVR